jgi:DNA-binding GntR family transcriptional regulator
MSALRPLDPSAATKAEAVLIALRAQLISGERPYGQILSSAEIAQEFGVSRRPVMDALLRLESAGFITIIRQVGCQVVIPDRRSVREHFYAAAVLEGAAAGLAAEHASAAQRAEIRAALSDSAAAAETNDVHGFEVANKRFHTATLTAGGNARIAELAHDAWNLSDFYLQRRTPEDLRVAHAEHEQVARLIDRGDAAATRQAMESHLARFGDRAILSESAERAA